MVKMAFLYYTCLMSTHSPAFVEQMRQLLEQEKNQLENDLATKAHLEQGNEVANFPEYERDDEANANEISDYTATSAVVEAKEARLKEVRAALERIAAGKYGFTSEGDIIPEKRLQANPAATTTIS